MSRSTNKSKGALEQPSGSEAPPGPVGSLKPGAKDRNLSCSLKAHPAPSSQTKLKVGFSDVDAFFDAYQAKQRPLLNLTLGMSNSALKG